MTKKSPSRSHARGAARKKLLEAPPGGMIVRMYRQGLGDCFLLGIAGNQRRKRKTRYILIDCGVHSRQDSGPDRLSQVMDDIVAATDGELDVIVATHEHADHLSGFIQKNSPFLTGKIKKVGKLWLGWTEKVGDAQADRLRKKRGTARSVIAKSLKDITSDYQGMSVARKDARKLLTKRIEHFKDFEKFPDDSEDEEAIAKSIREICDSRSDPKRARANIDELYSVADDIGESDGIAVAGRRRGRPSKNELALGVLAALAEDVICAEAGAVLEIPDAKHLRAYVLGPPRDEKLLKKDQPSKIRKSSHHESPDEHDGGMYKEVYLSDSSSAHAFKYAPAFGKNLPFSVAADFPEEEMRFPFHKSHHYVHPNDKRLADGSSFKTSDRIKTLFNKTYREDGAKWRQIEDDWLETCEHLALNLDSDTNNTSLVLAFELGKPGKGQVLLFPGDAQVGSWLSWRRQSYKAGAATVTADDLLRRTVLYKVGHHASHNATGRRDSTETTTEHPLGVPFGLELMDDIIAMIPVDRKAAQKNRPWEMPYSPLYHRLRERAHRRVLRSDLSLEPLETSSEKPDLGPTNRWSKTPGFDDVRWRAASKKFTAAPDTPLYYDVEFGPKRD